MHHKPSKQNWTHEIEILGMVKNLIKQIIQ